MSFGYMSRVEFEVTGTASERARNLIIEMEIEVRA